MGIEMVEEICPECGVAFKFGTTYRPGLKNTWKQCPNGHWTKYFELKAQREARLAAKPTLLVFDEAHSITPEVAAAIQSASPVHAKVQSRIDFVAAHPGPLPQIFENGLINGLWPYPFETWRGNRYHAKKNTG